MSTTVSTNIVLLLLASLYILFSVKLLSIVAVVVAMVSFNNLSKERNSHPFLQNPITYFKTKWVEWTT